MRFEVERTAMMLGMLLAVAPARAAQEEKVPPRAVETIQDAIKALDRAQGRSKADRSMKAVPASNPGTWFDSDDYPKGAMRADRQGRVIAHLAIDSAGAVVGCTIATSSGTTLLDDKTCELAKEKGRFNPATDRRGRPVVGSYDLSILWKIPGEPQTVELASNPRLLKYTLEAFYNADGIMASCRVIEHQPADRKMDDCPSDWAGKQGARLTRDGKPVSYRIVQSLSREVFVTE